MSVHPAESLNLARCREALTGRVLDVGCLIEVLEEFSAAVPLGEEGREGTLCDVATAT